MRRAMIELWRYTRIVAILTGVPVAISALLWVPLALGLTFWFGGSAILATEYGRANALAAHGQFTDVSPMVFRITLWSERLAIVSILTLFACAVVMWLAEHWREER